MEEVKNFLVRISKMGHKLLAFFFILICIPGMYSIVFSFNSFQFSSNFFINTSAERRSFVTVNLQISNAFDRTVNFQTFILILYFPNFSNVQILLKCRSILRNIIRSIYLVANK